MEHRSSSLLPVTAEEEEEDRCRLVLVGSVLENRPNGSMRRQLVVLVKSRTNNKNDINNSQDDTTTDEEVDENAAISCGVQRRIYLNADDFPGVAIWMTVKGALQLLSPGVTIRVSYDDQSKDKQESPSSSSSSVVVDAVYATSIQIVSVNLRTPYLARLLSFSMEHLYHFFHGDDIISDDNKKIHNNTSEDTLGQQRHEESTMLSSVPSNLCLALAPLNEEECLSIIVFCQKERADGRAVVLWKHSALVELSVELQRYQNPNQPVKMHAPPKTSRATLQALERMEKRWVLDDHHDDHDHDHHDNNVEPHTENHDDRNERSIRRIQVDYTFHRETHSYTTNIVPQSEQDMTEMQNRNVNKQASSLKTTSNSSPLIFNGINVDPSQNIPNLTDERRQRYIDERKRPQVQSMLRLIQQLVVDGGRRRNRTLHIADIGGGRGYMAIAVAAYFSKSSSCRPMGNDNDDDKDRMDVHVTVIDNNESSLKAGQEHAKAAGLESVMSFVLCDVGNKEQIQELASSQGQPGFLFDLVVGLHCCGGLSEAAVELALSCQASFCVSTCCFRSNKDLASLTRFAVQSMTWTPPLKPPPSLHHSDDVCHIIHNNHTATKGEESEVQKQQHLQQRQDDCDRVSALAVCVGGKGQHRAIRAYNAMRLAAAKQRFVSHQSAIQVVDGSVVRAKNNNSTVLQTWLETFPVEYSVQNFVLMGQMIRKPKNILT